MISKSLLLFFALFCGGFTQAQTLTIDSLQSGLSFPPYCIYSDTTEDVIYVGGKFITAGGKYAMGIAKWDGENWDTLGCGFNLPDCNPASIQPPGTNMGGPEIVKILKYNGNIYAAGALYNINGIAANVAKFNGNTWEPLGGPVEGFVYDMAVFDNKLYVSSSLPWYAGDTLKLISLWNDTTWTAIGADMADINSCIYAFFGIEFYNGELYAFGDVSCWLGSGSLYKLNGTDWEVIPGFENGINITEMQVYDGKLIVAGAFTKTMGFAGNHIMAWDGAQWHDMDNGFEGNDAYSNGGPQSMEVCGDKLVVTSGYPVAGGKPIKHIAVWDGNRWCGYQANYQNFIAWSTGFINDDLYVGYGIVSALINGGDYNYIFKTKLDSTTICTDGVGLNEEAPTNTNFSIYPNPGNGYYTLNYTLDKRSDIKFTVYNSLGMAVYQEETTKAAGQYNYPVNLLYQPAGIYIARFEVDGQAFSRKVIKQ